MPWQLGFVFKYDLPRSRTGNRSKNMSVGGRFALGRVRANKSTGRVKTRRKAASWDTDFLLEILQVK